jgi:hypothetical protein
MPSGNDTIANENTDADHNFTSMLDNHPGVASAVLNCAGSKPTIIRLYLDLSDPSGLIGANQPMPNRFYQCAQIELSPND